MITILSRNTEKYNSLKYLNARITNYSSQIVVRFGLNQYLFLRINAMIKYTTNGEPKVRNDK